MKAYAQLLESYRSLTLAYMAGRKLWDFGILSLYHLSFCRCIWCDRGLHGPGTLQVHRQRKASRQDRQGLLLSRTHHDSLRPSCQVGGIVITNRPDSKNAQYQQCIKQGDILLNRYQHSTSDYVWGSCIVKIYTKTTFILQGAEAVTCDQHLRLLGKTSAPTQSYTQIDWSEIQMIGVH